MVTYLCHGFRWSRRSIKFHILLQDLENASLGWIMGRRSSSALLKGLAGSYDFLPRRKPFRFTGAVNDGGSGGCDGGDETEQHQQQERHEEEEEEEEEEKAAAAAAVPVALLEEYDLNQQEEAVRPFAYVADFTMRVDLGVSLEDATALYAKCIKEVAGKEQDGGVPGKSEDGGESGTWFEKLRDELQSDEKITWYVIVCDDEDRLFGCEDMDAALAHTGPGGEEGEEDGERTPTNSPSPKRLSL